MDSQIISSMKSLLCILGSGGAIQILIPLFVVTVFFLWKWVARAAPSRSLSSAGMLTAPLCNESIQLSGCSPESDEARKRNQLERDANLAINARDAMPCGGRLTISTSNANDLPAGIAASFRGESAGEWLVLEVADTGSGMDEATKKRIFEPFFTTKPVGKGTGLGLSTVYGIVHQFEGQIDLQSQVGTGTRFQIFFPVTAPCPGKAQVQLPEVVAREDSGTRTILLVDDEAALRMAVAVYLRSLGHQVLESQNALDAVELARHHSGSVDILVTDVVMPELRGPELTRQVKMLHPKIHVIHMSGYAEGALGEEISPEAAFLHKPFRFATLLEQLKLLPRKA